MEGPCCEGFDSSEEVRGLDAPKILAASALVHSKSMNLRLLEGMDDVHSKY